MCVCVISLYFMLNAHESSMRYSAHLSWCVMGFVATTTTTMSMTMMLVDNILWRCKSEVDFAVFDIEIMTQSCGANNAEAISRIADD